MQFLRKCQINEGTKMEKTIDCQLVKPKASFIGKQGLSYMVGISKETTGSHNLHMQLAIIPAMSQAKAHKHEHHETSVYALKGTTWVRYGEKLEKELEVTEGSFLYIPNGTPHLPFNKSKIDATVIIARTDANEQESVVMMPELDQNLLK